MLIVLSIAASASCALAASFAGAWTVPAMVAACVFAGAGTAGWYGVFLAEVARLAPPERVGLATGGALFFVYAAICVGPLAFTATVVGHRRLPARVLARSPRCRCSRPST